MKPLLNFDTIQVLNQQIGQVLNLNIHFHKLFLDASDDDQSIQARVP